MAEYDLDKAIQATPKEVIRPVSPQEIDTNPPRPVKRLSFFGLPKYPTSDKFVAPVPRQSWALEIVAGMILGTIIGGGIGIFAWEWPTILVAPGIGCLIGMVAGTITAAVAGPGGRWTIGGIVGAMGRIVAVCFLYSTFWLLCAGTGIIFIPGEGRNKD